MSIENFQPYIPAEEKSLTRGEKIPLPEADSISEDISFPIYTIKNTQYVALPMHTFWENFSEFPSLEDDQMFLAGNKNLELDVYNNNELTVENEYKWNHINSEYAVILLPYKKITNTIQNLT